MLAVRTPGAPHTTRTNAACDSAFPLERQGRLLRSRSISGLYSRSLHSGLQPPCLRFATAVTGRHARLGSRLLARLCRGRHLRRQTSTRLQGATLIEPDVRRYCQLGAEEAKLPRAQPSREYTSAHEGNTSRIAPGEEGAITSSSVLTGGKTVTAELEVVVDRSVSGEELLRMPG
jgi:hypothetical protein